MGSISSGLAVMRLIHFCLAIYHRANSSHMNAFLISPRVTIAPTQLTVTWSGGLWVCGSLAFRLRLLQSHFFSRAIFSGLDLVRKRHRALAPILDFVNFQAGKFRVIECMHRLAHPEEERNIQLKRIILLYTLDDD